MKLQVPHIHQSKFSQITWRKDKENEELTLFFKYPYKLLLKIWWISCVGWKKLKKWRGIIIGGEKNKEEESLRELSRKFKLTLHIKSSFGEKLHLCPSYYKNLSNKSLNLLFNQLNPFPQDISITKYFSWKLKFTLDTKLPFYPSKPSNFLLS